MIEVDIAGVDGIAMASADDVGIVVFKYLN